MPTKLLGYAATVSRNGNTFNSPSWIPLIMAKDIKETRTPAGTPDTSDRLTDTYSTIGTRYNLAIDFDALWNKGAGITALRTAFLAKTPTDLAVLDRAVASSGTGYRGEWLVTKMMFDFPLLGEQKVGITLKPAANHAASQGVAAYTDATMAAGTAESTSSKRLGAVASVNNSSGTPVTGVRDWKLNLEWTEVDGSDRADNFQKVLATQLKVGVELNFIWDSTDSTLTAFRTAFQAHSAIDLYVLDGAYATSGSWGYHADFAVTDFSKDDPLTNGQMVTVKLEAHGNATTTPTAVTI